MGDDVKVVSLSEVVELNPKLDRSLLTDDTEVSFVPMVAVEAASGRMDPSRIRRYAEVKKGYTHFRDGDVLFAKITPCMENGKMAVAHGLHNGIGLGSTEFHVLRPRESVDPYYVYHFVSSQRYRSEAAHHMTGAVGQKRVPAAFLEQSQIPLPELDDQRRIVAEIEKQFSRLDEAGAGLQRVKANLKRYKAAVLKAAVEGRLVDTEADLARRAGRDYETGAQLLQRILATRRQQWQGKGKYKEPAAPDTADLPELPEGWAYTSLDTLSWDSAYGTSEKCSYENTGFAVLRIPNVQNGTLNLDDLKFASPSLSLSVNEAVASGDMLVIRTNGSKSLIGRAAVVLTPPPRALGYASYLIRFRLLEVESIPSWVSIVWQSPQIRSWVEAHAATSAGQHNLSMTTLATAAIPLPPLPEQHRIVAEVDRLLSIAREAEAEVEANLQRAQALRQATLTRAFQPAAVPPAPTFNEEIT
jgi:type I restriction enzyme S subunit